MSDARAARVLDPLEIFLVREDDGPPGTFTTRATLDIQYNAIAVTDALGRIAAMRTFDALGTSLATIAADTGTSLAFHDVLGGQCRGWDARFRAACRLRSAAPAE